MHVSSRGGLTPKLIKKTTCMYSIGNEENSNDIVHVATYCGLAENKSKNNAQHIEQRATRKHVHKASNGGLTAEPIKTNHARNIQQSENKTKKQKT